MPFPTTSHAPSMANDDEELSIHHPDEDIDEFIQQVDGFRIERMGRDAVWVNIFDEDLDTDIHYDISCGEDGLHITRRDESDYHTS